MPKLELKALASQKKYSLEINHSDQELSLLDFLRKNNFPIASSCNGDGVCEKCIVNKNILSCQISVGDVLKRKMIIEVGYL